MKSRSISRAIFLIVGLTACATVTWSGRMWPIQPLPEAKSLKLNEEERAVYDSFRRTDMRLGFVLNTVYYTSTLWLVIGGSSLLRQRVVRRRTMAARG